MKKISIFLLFISFSVSSIYAQVLENNLNVVFSGGTSNIYGNTVINENNFIVPALYTNYEKGNNYKLKIEYQLKPLIDLALKMENHKFIDWHYETQDTYFKNSTNAILLFSPAMQLHNKFHETGIFNRLKIYFELSPQFGKSKLTLRNPVFDIYSISGTSSVSVLGNSDFIWGAEASAGLNMTLTNSLGLYASYSFSYNRVNSVFYSDNQFSRISLNLGFFIRLFNNKHFYY